MREGFFLVHRQYFTKERFKDLHRSYAWLDLLSMVDHKTHIVSGSYRFLAFRWGVSESTAFRWIQRWVHERSLERQTERDAERDAERWLVLNYAKYQQPKERNIERDAERQTERDAEQIETSTIRTETIKKKHIHTSVPTVPDDVNAMFDLYVRIVDRQSVGLGVRKKYLSRMRTRLSEYGAEGLRRAWEEMAKNDWLMGENPGHVKYLHNIEYALRTEKIDEYLSKAGEYEFDAEAAETAPRIETEFLTRPDGTRVESKVAFSPIHR